jgi:hypothetical protein
VLPRLLFIAWMASLGADRIDLLGGRGPAVLLPFHVLTPLVLLAFGFPRLPQMTVAFRAYAAWLLALLTLVGLSLLQSADLTISAGRFTLFGSTMIGVAAVLWSLWERDDREALIQTGARAGLGVSIAFNVATLFVLLGVLPATLELGVSVIDLSPLLYGVLPRLAGPTVDMNRGAMLVLVFGTIVAMGPRKSGWWIAAAALMLVGSLSRSAMLATATVLLVALWRSRSSAKSIEGAGDSGRAVTAKSRARLAGAAALSLLCIVAITQLNPSVRESSARTVAPLAERLDPREVSAQTHAYLIERGVEAGTRSLPQALLGIGFGTSFRELADVFDGNRYGNYHSAWLQLWVEAGFVVMLLAMAVALLPLRRRPRLAGLVLGLFVYNVFYIGIGEPQYWLATGLAWLERGA